MHRKAFSTPLIIHVGPPKTGTSSIQGNLSTLREMLLQRGTLYPKTGFERGKHRGFSSTFSDASRSPSGSDRVTPSTLVQALADEILSCSPERVLLSAEGFSPKKVGALLEGAPFDNVKVIFCLRAPEDRLESVYANRVKNGRIVQSPEKFLDDNLPLLNDYEEYRAYQTLENVEALLLPFEDASSPDGLVKRFFSLIGHNEVVPKELGRNKRLSPIMLELIRNRTEDVDFSSKKYAEFRRVTNSFVDDDKNLAIFGPDSKRRISEYYQADYEKLLRLLPNSTNGETHNYLTKPSLVYRERLKSTTLPHSEVFRLLWSLWGVLWDENKRLKVEIRSLKENSRNQ